MTQKHNHYSRRNFIKTLMATSAVTAGALPTVLTSKANAIPLEAPVLPSPPDDPVRFATVGMGIIGFIDTDTALKVPGTQFVAAADLYSGRLVRTKEIFGQDIFTSRDYREVLARADVDAVIVSTSDHWHSRVAIDAMKAGKDVYCEKPMVHELDQGPAVIKTAKDTKRILQVGSQMVSSIMFAKARELYMSGAIGELNMVMANTDRNTSIGAWQYSIPPDASTETVDWDTFLGSAPKRPFDPVRFFRWRNYWDYGTGIPGDLYVHLFSSIHFTLDSAGPTSIMSTGGLRYWKDGRDVPDVMLGIYDYPASKSHPAFSLVLSTDLANGGTQSSEFKLIGSEGMISIGWDGLTLSRRTRRIETERQIVEGYNSVRTFSKSVQDDFVKAFRAKTGDQMPPTYLDGSSEYKAPDDYDPRVDHFANFFAATRSRKPVVEDAVFGHRAAAPSLITNLSYRNKQIFQWDPEKLELVS